MYKMDPDYRALGCCRSENVEGLTLVVNLTGTPLILAGLVEGLVERVKSLGSLGAIGRNARRARPDRCRGD